MEAKIPIFISYRFDSGQNLKKNKKTKTKTKTKQTKQNKQNKNKQTNTFTNFSVQFAW